MMKYLVLTIQCILCFVLIQSTVAIGASIPEPYSKEIFIAADTIPIKDRQGDFITDKQRNPFDLKPKNITQSVEYDPVTDKYYIIEKIGNEYYRNPTYLTFEEYLDYKSKEQEKKYFERLSGLESDKKSGSGLKDPMLGVDVSKNLVDRLFGGSEVTIKPQGRVDLTLGFDYQRRDDPNLLLQQQRQLFFPDFNMNPRLSVDGGIGEKLKLNFNYDAQATFDFDRQIKLRYDAAAFSEDDIIKNIEAGNVSFPLKSKLINGPQSLLGFKTELQFGRLRIGLLASQQRSRQNNIQIQNGAAITEFEITPDEYDENRHFFLSHFNRETYERTLSNLPQINTSFAIAQIEVWISDDRPDYQEGSTMIAAISDLAEGDINKFHDRNSPYPPPAIQPTFLTDINGRPLADNRANPIFENLINDPTVNEIDKTASALRTQFGMSQTRDFEVFRGRLLNPSEYTFHPQLGTLSLNIRLRPNQVLGVSYKYYYTLRCDTVYTVGQLAGEGLQSSDEQSLAQPVAPKVIFTKLLKSSNQQVSLPSWDLMMKNVYNLRTNQLNREGFEFDIFYEDDFDDGSLKKFIPIEGLRRRPLLNIFKLDTLNRFGDPQADGIFDYVPGVTVIERSGSIVFPVLEPFGSSLAAVLDPIIGPDEASRFTYQELYDTTISIARLSLEKNKFLMIGRVKSNSSGEYNLGAFVPRGSVRVRAGGIELVEGQDYEIDYSLGRLRVINPSYLSQGTPLNISFEDNAAFSLQQKNMMGLRLDYQLNKKMALGLTYLRLQERPFSQKVNVGDDPINNRVIGLDLNYANEVPFITKMVDKLPFYSTKEKSTINISAEAAALIPGNNSQINLPNGEGGVVSLDDFEGAITGVTLGGFNVNAWSLASTPPEFREAELSNDVRYGANRALLNWYQIDRSARKNSTSVGGGLTDITDPYTRLVDQTELFQRQLQIGQTEQFTFDLSYYPEERGPYNFDMPDGFPGISSGLSFDAERSKVLLNNPRTRWGGIMRYMQNNDFEAANFEFIEFWMLNPFMDRRDGEVHGFNEEGEIVFNLGSVSEDILHDNLQFYENGLPAGNDNPPTLSTRWGRTSLNIPINNGFDLVNGRQQDLGLDGLDDDAERDLHAEYLQELSNRNWIDPEIFGDPSGDNFRFFNDPPLLEAEDNLVTRLKKFNHPQGNAPLENDGNTGGLIRGNRLPDQEDLNNNRSLDQGESYYEYRLRVRNNGGEIDTIAAGAYYRQKIVISRTNGPQEIWYRFQIPLRSGTPRGGITGFRSIQFMRMYMTQFEKPKTFRLAEFQLLRSQWRRTEPIRCEDDGDPASITFNMDKIGREENSNKSPFNYITPNGIQPEVLTGQFGALRQDERSMSLNFCNLSHACPVAINKLTRLDLTQYDKIQLFVHAESKNQPIQDGDLRLSLKIGKDLVNNYYEYEIPLTISKLDVPTPQDTSNVWPRENFINLELKKFLDLKKMKLVDGILEMEDPDRPGAIIRIKGVPSLGLVKVIEVGLVNRALDRSPMCGEVWVNELRAVGLNNRGGVAGLATMQIKMADLGELNVAGSFSTIGWGQIEQRLMERRREAVRDYSLAANLQLGKLLPEALGLSLPFYAQYTRSVIKPQFDPYQRDLTVDEMVELAQTEEERQDVLDRAQVTRTIKSYNFTNVKVNGAKGSTPKPWSPENISVTYAFNEELRTDPIIKEDRSRETTLGLDYNYNRKSTYIQPFKSISSPLLKIISEINFNPLPSRIGFQTELNRFTNARTFRLPTTPVFRFDDQRFRWNRNYNLDWDITRSIRFNYKANVTAIVDELRQVGIADDPADRDWVNERGVSFNDEVLANPDAVDDYRNANLRRFGRSKSFNHQFGATYKLPISLLPFMDWVNISADYKGEYGWTAGALITIDELGTPLGNIIQNKQNRSLNATFSFDKLYSKIGYLKRIEQGKQAAARTRPAARPSARNADGKAADKPAEREKKERDPSTIERILIRPLLALRNIKITYREDFGTQIPGFMPDSRLLGLSDGFGAPGLGFAAGAQPDISRDNPNNWLLSNREWFNPSPNFNDQLSQTQRQSIGVKVAIEPFKDFILDIDMNKNFRQDHTELFKAKDGNFMQLAAYDIGSFDITHFSANTLFRDNVELYARFKQNRLIASQVLPNKPGAGQHQEFPDYAEGYGPTSYAVNVPSFLAAYTGKTIDQVPLDLVENVRPIDYLPSPNWNLRYNGLSKLSIFKDIFSTIAIKHGYRNILTVSRFNSTPDFNALDPFNNVGSNFNYYSRLEIPAISVNEQFNPIIGVDIKTKSNMNINFEWKKSRIMELRLNANELGEQLGSELVFGYSYTIRNFNGFTRSKKRSSRRNRDAPADTPPPPTNPGANAQGARNLIIQMTFSVRDDRALIYNLGNNADPQPRRGQKTTTIGPNVTYEMFENLTLKVFVDYNATRPYATNQFPITNVRGGLTASFILK